MSAATAPSPVPLAPAMPHDPSSHEQPSSKPSPSQDTPRRVEDLSAQKTPTRDSFTANTANESTRSRPESGSAVSDEPESKDTALMLEKSDSKRSSWSKDSEDAKMADEDDDPDAVDGSDNDSDRGESDRPSKKKKGQRFFCTDFPPCQLSFTRSEHLARHIRKHTGERPFQCHCLRRFSRLDNLRQHAQTVHVNEEIPGDSLAATGTRFQRQIRMDRMRPPANRARGSTVGSSQPSHARGHTRNYSGSSIGSLPSDIGSPDDTRRRPQPLAMAPSTPQRAGLTIDTLSANSPDQKSQPPYYSYSPSGYSTPVYSAATGSPRTPSNLQSPVINIQQPSGAWQHRRRLSVPSQTNPFPGVGSYPPMSLMSPIASTSGSTTFSNGSSMLTSPTASIFSESRGDDEPLSDLALKRRTWHPGSYSSRPATSGLSYYRTPDAPQPVFAAQPAAAQTVRLPGIDSFDRAGAQPLAPPRRLLDPMEIESSERRTPPTSTPEKQPLATPRSNRNSWSSMDYNFRQLEVEHSPPSRDQMQWRSEAQQRPLTAPYGEMASSLPANLGAGHQVIRKEPTGKEEPPTPQKKKRQVWYNGPVASSRESLTNAHHRTSPGGSTSSDGIPTPSSASVADYTPTIVHSNGEVELHPQGLPPHPHESHKPHTIQHEQPSYPPQHSYDQTRPRGDTDRLDALVAVATSEGQASH